MGKAFRADRQCGRQNLPSGCSEPHFCAFAARSQCDSLAYAKSLSADSGRFAKLDLAVRDLELAGLERTSFNLSGGETFLVSLALALALSRVSSSRMQVDTLFLDEGFGTLDPDTLEKALNALEMLQQKTGKLIGIISHVRAVRERVGVHIVVKPRGTSGESEVSGPGVRFEAQPAA